LRAPLRLARSRPGRRSAEGALPVVQTGQRLTGVISAHRSPTGGAVDLGDVDQGHPEVDARWIVRINCSSSSLAPVYYADIAIAPKPMRATSKRPNLTCFIAFLPAYAATNRVRLRDATMVDSADAPASVARQSRYA